MRNTLATIACATLLLGGIACGDDGGDGTGGGGSGGSGTGTATGMGGAGGSGTGTAGGMGGMGDGGSMCTGMGELMFGDACDCDEQCASDLCYPFGTGSRCTIPCPTDPADCPNMGEGCNNMDPAVCKTP